MTPIESLANCLAPLIHAADLVEARWKDVQGSVADEAQRKDATASVAATVGGARDVVEHLTDYLERCRKTQTMLPIAEFMRRAVDCAHTDAHLMCEFLFGQFPMRMGGITIKRIALSGEMTSLYSWLSFVRVHVLRGSAEGQTV